MSYRSAIVAVAVLALHAATAAAGGDIDGTWSASIQTQGGTEKYLYEFLVEGTQLSGHARCRYGESPLISGRVENGLIMFVEYLRIDDADFTVSYVGRLVSADQIQFSRLIQDVAIESFTATRVHPQSPRAPSGP